MLPDWLLRNGRAPESSCHPQADTSLCDSPLHARTTGSGKSSPPPLHKAIYTKKKEEQASVWNFTAIQTTASTGHQCPLLRRSQRQHPGKRTSISLLTAPPNPMAKPYKKQPSVKMAAKDNLQAQQCSSHAARLTPARGHAGRAGTQHSNHTQAGDPLGQQHIPPLSPL